LIYARNDIATVSIGPAHGGCGQVHERPRDAAGEPVQTWGLSCAGGCEEYLRSDPLWAAMLLEVPETPDEQKNREGIERHGRQSQDSIVARALARLAGFDMATLPASMTRGAIGAAPFAGLVACPGCSAAQGSGANFCGMCGSPMRSAVPAAAVTSGAAA
jgi:hypothetical protein